MNRKPRDRYMGKKSTEIGVEENDEPKTSETSLNERALGSSQALENLNHVLNDSMNHWNHQIRELQYKTDDLITTLKLLIRLSSENAEQDEDGERIDATAKDLLVDHLFTHVLKEQQKLLLTEGGTEEKMKSEVETNFIKMFQLLNKQMN